MKRLNLLADQYIIEKMLLTFNFSFKLLLKYLFVRFFSINRSIFITFSKIIFFSIICFCTFLLFIEKPKADIFEEKLKRQVINSKNLNAKKRKARKIAAKKTNGRVIKYYLIRKSSIQSKKSKEKSAANQMLDAGLITANMVKKNRWFVKKPYETSYTKITSIKNDGYYAVK